MYDHIHNELKYSFYPINTLFQLFRLYRSYNWRVVRLHGYVQLSASGFPLFSHHFPTQSHWFVFFNFSLFYIFYVYSNNCKSSVAWTRRSNNGCESLLHLSFSIFFFCSSSSALYCCCFFYISLNVKTITCKKLFKPKKVNTQRRFKQDWSQCGWYKFSGFTYTLLEYPSSLVEHSQQ